MPIQPWQRRLSQAAPCDLDPDAETGLLKLCGCCHAAGGASTLYCEVAGREYALCAVSAEKPHCGLDVCLDQPCTLRCLGGDLLVLGGTWDGTSAAGFQPKRKQARTSASSPAPASAAPPESGGGSDAETAARRSALRSAQAASAKALADEKRREEERAASVDAARERRLEEDRKRKAESLAVEKEAAAKLAAKKAAKQQAEESSSALGKGPNVLKSGLKYIVTRPGKGSQAARGNQVQVKYSGRLAKTGKRFDSGMIKFKLGRGEVIRGWDEGVSGMRVGEQRKLLVPPSLGYGKRGAPPDIPPNAELAFDVELLRC